MTWLQISYLTALYFWIGTVAAEWVLTNPDRVEYDRLPDPCRPGLEFLLITVFWPLLAIAAATTLAEIVLCSAIDYSISKTDDVLTSLPKNKVLRSAGRALLFLPEKLCCRN